jgi:hypothetical protein
MITANGPHEIKFVITKSPGIEGIAQYSSFSVGSEQNKYVLTIAITEILLKVTLNTINLTLTVRKSFDKHIL